MNNRKITKYAIYAVAVLSATLINQLFLAYVQKYISIKGYLLVLVDMLIVVLIFAPTFALVAKYTKRLSKAYIGTSRKVSKNSRKGTLFGFFIAILILFVLYAVYRHQLHILNDLKIMFPKIFS